MTIHPKIFAKAVKLIEKEGFMCFAIKEALRGYDGQFDGYTYDSYTEYLKYVVKRLGASFLHGGH